MTVIKPGNPESFCPHGVNLFDPNGCKKCADIARGSMRPPYHNGHPVSPTIFRKESTNDDNG